MFCQKLLWNLWNSFLFHCSAEYQTMSSIFVTEIGIMAYIYLHFGPALLWRVHNSILIGRESSLSVSGCWVGSALAGCSDINKWATQTRHGGVEEWWDKQTWLSYLLLTDCSYVAEYIFYHSSHPLARSIQESLLHQPALVHHLSSLSHLCLFISLLSFSKWVKFCALNVFTHNGMPPPQKLGPTNDRLNSDGVISAAGTN